MTVQTPPLRLGDEELASVESFRKLKDTAVLTIMFTDIVGFTQLTDEKGEHHSNEVRRLHDEVLEKAITKDGAGVVVKHIGDAIMAVFSEPSTGVERALRIHEGLARLARERPDIEPILVKIGLDMGQVTVEDNVDADVFGRHVNRASRIEGMAAGGQVLMTYTVFDSARAWLSTPDNARFGWASHGKYRLKGVSAPVEVFEVADPERHPLRAPRGGKKARSVPGMAWAAGLVLLGVAATIGFGAFQSTELWLAEYAPPLSYLDGVELRLRGTAGDGERPVHMDVRPGRHVL
jgi:class 3 adenylate cyclase